mmetsp:Transcript_27343/g.55050  ORF Transcript_27343/g.55050 Transcript_27343/m.55050 type:complete len:90 (+) Transcript_27343:150-419(+)
MAARVLRTELTPQKAADHLLRYVTSTSKNMLGRLKDDTTVVVVDLNPSGVGIPKRAMLPCCATSSTQVSADVVAPQTAPVVKERVSESQ